MDINKQIAYYEHKCELNPGSRAFAPLADLYRRAGRFDDAFRLLEAGLAAHPRYISALVILGRCYLETGDRPQSRGVFHQVLEIDPDNLVVLKLMAEDAARQEDWNEATGLLERVVLLDPSDAPAEAELAALRARQGGQGRSSVRPRGPAPPVEPATPLDMDVEVEPVRPPRPPAETLYHPAPPPPPRDVQALGETAPRSLATKTLAEIYLAQGYRDKALEVLREILARHPEREDIRAQIADLEREAAASGAPLPEGRESLPPPPRPGVRSRRHFESWIDRISHGSDEET
jgi:tetratricopeptide (TPR) repeat protein